MQGPPIHPLTQAREAKNLTQKELAIKVKLSEKTIWSAEHNRPISPYVRRRLCKYFKKTSQALGLVVNDISTTNELTSTSPTVVADEKTENVTPVDQTPKYVSADLSSLEHNNSNELLQPFSQPTTEHKIPVGEEPEEQGLDILRCRMLQQALHTTGTVMVASSDTLLTPSIFERFSRVLTNHSNIDETTLRYLETRTNQYWLDRHSAVVSSPDLLIYALEHFQRVITFLEWSMLPTIRTHLCSIASGTAQLVGHLLFDMNYYTDARAFHKLAITAAQEANNSSLEAVAWGRMSFTWTYSGNAQKALPCIQQARRLAEGKTTNTVQAYLAAVEAEIQATLGDSDACMKALNGAECIKYFSQTDESNYWLRFDRSRLAGYQGACFRRLYNPEDHTTTMFLSNAQRALKDALARLEASMLQRRPALLIDIASTYTHQGEIEKACEYAIQAVTIIKQIRSKAAIKRLLALRQDLEQWKSTSYVRNLDKQIEPLLVPESMRRTI
jgi:transcriptional regulator with XRE-family HTH domain/tetratricopeptide (TPR) repeat protein